MTIVPLIWLALGGLAEEPDLTTLIERLDAAAPAERDRAAAALEEVGLPALPALRAARAGGDPERARRIAALIDEIGRQRLLRPTSIALDLEDRSLADAVAALGRASGFAVALVPEDDPRWRERRVSLLAPKGLGFWEALDRIGAAGGVRLDTPPSRFPARGPAVRLVPHEGPWPPSAYAGPYRALVTGLHRHSQVSLASVPAESKAREEFHVALQIVAEPGLIIERNGPPRLLEATDDQDRDLCSVQVSDSSSPGANPMRRWDSTILGTLTYTIPLKLPEPRGTRIKRLRGYVPITAVARTGRVLAFSLKRSEGRTFTAGGVTVTVRRFGTEHGQASPLQLLIYGASELDAPAFAPGPNQRTLGPLRLRFSHEDHVQVVDAQGRPYTGASFNRSPTADGKGGTQLTIFPGPSGPPAEVRYFDVAAVATEVPFDFTDLPLP
jgi:hypothetical protein